jgi:hypothetical protein
MHFKLYNKYIMEYKPDGSYHLRANRDRDTRSRARFLPRQLYLSLAPSKILRISISKTTFENGVVLNVNP